jgi:hypothetical protein
MKSPLRLSVKRNRRNWVRVGHRGQITGFLRNGFLAHALDYATLHNELDWYQHKLAYFRPDIVLPQEDPPDTPPCHP